MADLSAETLQARREWQDIFKILKGKNLKPRLLCLARISFKIDGEIKIFSSKSKILKDSRSLAYPPSAGQHGQPDIDHFN